MAYLLPAIDTHAQWSAIFRDMALWEPVVAEICSLEGLRYSHVEASYPGTHAVFLLDRRFALKVFCPLWPDFSVERELHVALAGGGVPLPKLVTSGRLVDRIAWNYLITEFMDGVPVRDLRDTLGPDDVVDVAIQLEAIVRGPCTTRTPRPWST